MTCSAPVFLCVAFATLTCAMAATQCSTPAAVVCDIDCENVVVCLGDGLGGWREEVVEGCDAQAGTHCYAPLRQCEARNSCEAPGLPPFECTSVGQFPDPFDCQKYYICVPENDLSLTAYRTQCEAGYAYNASRGLCNLPLDHPTCVTGPVPRCDDVGQLGALPENTSIYYVCKRREDALYPVLFVCPHGDAFNDTIATCDPSSRHRRDAVVDDFQPYQLPLEYVEALTEEV